jgi:hypothetical protein
VGGPRVKEGGGPHTVDVDDELHGLAGSWMDPGEGMDGDGGVGGIGRRLHDLVEHLDGEQLLADFLVAVREELITVEALTVLTALCDLRRGEALDGGRRLGHRSKGCHRGGQGWLRRRVGRLAREHAQGAVRTVAAVGPCRAAHRSKVALQRRRGSLVAAVPHLCAVACRGRQ